MEQVPRKYDIVGVRISATSYAEVTRICADWMGGPAVGTARYICVTSVHGIISSRQEPWVRDVLNAADIATPDGMPVVWALRSFGARGQQRVYGPTLMLHLCRMAAERGHGIYLYGGTGERLELLRRKLLQQIPNLRIAGSYAPPFRPLNEQEDQYVKEDIRNSGARLVFIGISTPKQDKWMFDHRSDFPGVVMAGVGAAFDFHAGNVKQAPAWMQRAGLEWFFRLAAEPRRLWKRYVLITPRFLPLWALQWIASHTYERNARA